MIKSFRHKGLKRFFETGSTAGINPAHATRLRRQLTMLNRAASPNDVNIPSWNLHALKGARHGYWALTVSGNWRVVFAFDQGDALHVEYLDYH